LAVQAVTKTQSIYCKQSVAYFELGYAMRLVKWPTFHPKVKKMNLWLNEITYFLRRYYEC